MAFFIVKATIKKGKKYKPPITKRNSIFGLKILLAANSRKVELECLASCEMVVTKEYIIIQRLKITPIKRMILEYLRDVNNVGEMFSSSFI